jgi:hypothetical protein
MPQALSIPETDDALPGQNKTLHIPDYHALIINITTDPNISSFINVAPDSNFPIQNLPYGVLNAAMEDQPALGWPSVLGF